MFPALYTYFTRALEIYTFEHADGAGRAIDLVIQPFVRFTSMAFFPVIICAGVLYLSVNIHIIYTYNYNVCMPFQNSIGPVIEDADVILGINCAYKLSLAVG